MSKSKQWSAAARQKQSDRMKRYWAEGKLGSTAVAATNGAGSPQVVKDLLAAQEVAKARVAEIERQISVLQKERGEILAHLPTEEEINE